MPTIECCGRSTTTRFQAFGARRQLHRVAGQSAPYRSLLLDSEARIAVSFERIHWDEQEVVNRTIEVLKEQEAGAGMRRQSGINPLVIRRLRVLREI
jgi:hypothetical protein